jgi:putative NIF3 family GTP cyclohydrolase 1 type 2
MGLVCDFTTEINKVYTAVFPSKDVLQKVLDSGAQDAMLFVHHPAIWDIRKAPKVFQQIDKELLQQFKNRRISIYNLHVPLDNYGEYSTSVSLARILKIKPEKPFGFYFGSLCGVFGKTDLETVQDLRKRFKEVVGHEISLYNYGDNEIKSKIVAVIAGGGNNVDMLEEIAKASINTFVTGITIKNDYSKKTHEFAEEHKINILGGTHYSTEKFACIAMCDYFEKIGLPSEFVEGEPLMEDM